jgi:hypothetical protein
MNSQAIKLGFVIMWMPIASARGTNTWAQLMATKTSARKD